MKGKKAPVHIRALLSSWIIAIGALLAGTAVLAALISKNAIAENASGYGLTIILLAASLSGSIAMLKTGDMNKMLAVVTVAPAMWLSLLAVNALLFDGTYNGVAATLLLIVGGSFAAVLLTGKHKKRSKSSMRYKRNR